MPIPCRPRVSWVPTLSGLFIAVLGYQVPGYGAPVFWCLDPCGVGGPANLRRIIQYIKSLDSFRFRFIFSFTLLQYEIERIVNTWCRGGIFHSKFIYLLEIFSLILLFECKEKPCCIYWTCFLWYDSNS